MTTPRHTEYDLVVVGSGIAGLYAALQAHEAGARVLVVTKGGIGEASTRYAQGGIAAAVGPDDDPGDHLKDTIEAGAGLVDEEAARILCYEAAPRIADLVRYGVSFDSTNGEVALGREAAHSRARILHARGDATGLEIELSLSSLAQREIPFAAQPQLSRAAASLSRGIAHQPDLQARHASAGDDLRRAPARPLERDASFAGAQLGRAEHHLGGRDL